MNQVFDNISEEALKDDEDLMKFLRGELSADEEEAFMQKLQHNPDLKARAVAVARLIKGLENKGVADDKKIKAAFKKLSVDDVKKLTKPAGKTVKFKQIFAWVASAAAVLVLVFGLRIFYVNSTYEKIAAEYENSFDISDVSRGGDENMEEKVKILCNNVLSGTNLDTTIESLNQIFTKSQDETFNVCTNYFQTSGWFLSLAHLKNHDPEKAKSILKILIENPDTKASVREKSEELLKRIE